ncbi:hypothetical protein ACFXK0_05515 [Nocardia sp. NPDC059177]|uniref:hypothetical protein n=1 Tax=Nocardia sp. NPDC059177 TaxID=3346759 RepID=UPI00367AC99A
MANLLQAAVEAIRSRLPSTWSVTVTWQPKPLRGMGRVDASLILRSPAGAEVEFVVEVKTSVTTREVSSVKEQLGRYMQDTPGVIGMVVASYLSEPTRERLSEAGLSYVDITGNMLVRGDAVGLFLSDRGARSDPRRGPGRPKEGLNGGPAAKVVRALVDIRGPWRVRNLITESGASTGSVYRVLEYLEQEELIARQGGEIDVLDWQGILRRWSTSYQFLHANQVTRWIAPRGLPSLLDRLRATEVDYAITGSVAASAWAQYAPVRSAMLYTADPVAAAQRWGLHAAETGANVLIAEPVYPVVQRRSVRALDGLVMAAPAQVVVDLMTGPGRAPSEAEELLDWMGQNESVWRRRQFQSV